MEQLLSQWNFMRVLRLLMGVLVIAQGLAEADWIFILLGSAFAFLAITNKGCWAGDACQPAYKRHVHTHTTDDTAYEEIK